MKLKAKTIRTFIIVIAIVVLVGIVLLSLPFFGQKDYLFIQDDRLYFGKTSLGVILEKGIPVENDTGVVSPSTTYCYEETIDGYDVWCSYECFQFRLTNAEYIFEKMDYSTALSFTENIADKQKKHYSRYDGYHCSDVQVKEDGTFSLALGVTTTPEIISFIYTFDGEHLKIRAQKHY